MGRTETATHRCTVRFSDKSDYVTHDTFGPSFNKKLCSTALYLLLFVSNKRHRAMIRVISVWRCIALLKLVSMIVPDAAISHYGGSPCRGIRSLSCLNASRGTKGGFVEQSISSVCFCEVASSNCITSQITCTGRIIVFLLRS